MKAGFYGLLGMALRAGKIISGDAAVEASLKKGKGKLLIIAEDAPGSLKKFQKWAEDLNLPLLLAGEKIELGKALGQSPRAVVLVMDEGFAKAIKNKELMVNN